MKTIDRLSIYALSLTVLGLVLCLIWQKGQKQGDKSDFPKDRDLFNMQSYKERQNQFTKDIQREERLGKK